jgi:hypothetical protein
VTQRKRIHFLAALGWLLVGTTLQIPRSFYFREESAHGGGIALHFDHRHQVRSKFIYGGRPAFRQNGQINIPRFCCRLTAFAVSKSKLLRIPLRWIRTDHSATSNVFPSRVYVRCSSRDFQYLACVLGNDRFVAISAALLSIDSGSFDAAPALMPQCNHKTKTEQVYQRHRVYESHRQIPKRVLGQCLANFSVLGGCIQ